MSSPEPKVKLCNRPGCLTVIKPGQLACREHWHALTSQLRDQLVFAWEQRKAHPDVPELVHAHRVLLVMALQQWGVSKAEMRAAMAKAPRAIPTACPDCGAAHPLHRAACPRVMVN